MTDLYTNWHNLLSRYTNDNNLIIKSFENISKAYDSPKRHYHNLTHIQNLLEITKEHLNNLALPDSLLFAIWYHDIIYNILKKDNEKQSADFCRKHLNELNLYPDFINKTCHIIERTANHFVRETAESAELQLMLDADLQTLGASPEIYEANAKAIRREYAVFPDIIFNKGRKKVLQIFLASDSIYRTDFFRTQYEKQARINIKNELNTLINRQ